MEKGKGTGKCNSIFIIKKIKILLKKEKKKSKKKNQKNVPLVPLELPNSKSVSTSYSLALMLGHCPSS